MKTFEELKLIEPLRRAVADQRYHQPTPIQAQALPSALEGRDVLGCAQTGTGKTAAFALPVLNQLGRQNQKAAPRSPLALVLAPTRELAIQISESFAAYGAHLRLRQAVIYGGVSQHRQVKALTRGVHIAVATPGRLIDLMEQGYVSLDRLKVFVLDEVDRMLDMGFLPDLKRVIRELPSERQSLFFSATLPPKIVELSNQLLRDPISVNVTPETPSVKKIKQQVTFVERSGKLGLLKELLDAPGTVRTLVFTRTKRGANALTEKLVRSGVKAAAIHGNKSQNARQQALAAFQQSKVHVLVATDVAARGIDVEHITHVVNYDVPHEPESYVHRIGRTGRAGERGIAVTYCTSSEHGELRAIESLIGQKIARSGSGPDPKPAAPSRGGAKPRNGAKPRGAKPRGGPRAASESDKPRRRRRRRRNDGRPTSQAR